MRQLSFGALSVCRDATRHGVARRPWLALAAMLVHCGHAPIAVDAGLDHVADAVCSDACGAADGNDATVDACRADGGDGASTLDAFDADATSDDGAPACPTGPFGAGNWPPACWRPYADTSAFNTRVPSNPRLMANSDAIMARIFGDLSTSKQPANMGAPVDGTGGWPTYWGTASDPLYTIQCNEFGGGCSIAGMSVHAPAGAVIQGGNAAVTMVDWDRHMTLVDQTTGWEFDLWHVSTSPLPAGGGTIDIGWGGQTRIDGDGISTPNGQGTASHFGNLAGRIRVEELAVGRIAHALTVAINCDDGTFVWPAQASDHVCTNTTDAPPMGAHFWLDLSDAAIDALPVPQWKITVLHTLADYGMYMNDTGSSFYFDWQLEAGNQYTSMGYADPWLAFAMANGWQFYAPDNDYTGTFHANDDGIDWDVQVWSHLHVLDPCVAQGTCP